MTSSPTPPAPAPITASDLAPAVRLVGSRSGRWESRLENPKAIAQLLGTNVLAAFYKCFAALDRTNAIEHLMFINNEHSKNEVAPVAEGATGTGRSPAVERNFHFLMLMMAGTLYEFAEALQNVQSTQVVRNLKDRSAWEPLDLMRRKWPNDPMANKLRNGFAHHLGDLNAYQRGIDNSSEVVVFETGHSPRRGMTRFVAPLDALLFGEDIQDDKIESFLERMSKDHIALPEMMFAFYWSVLHENGIAMIDETTS